MNYNKPPQPDKAKIKKLREDLKEKEKQLKERKTILK